jgi:D-serine deaminase-like pyridoxal phosphate-dependent protein
MDKNLRMPGAPGASWETQVSNPLPPLVTERLRELRERPVEPVEKGFGPRAGAGPDAGDRDAGDRDAGDRDAGDRDAGDPDARGPSAASVAAARPLLHRAGFTYPLLILRETALAANLEAMAAYCAQAGVALAPHGKTAMSPELAARQLALGAWGITVATIGQLRTYRAFGFPRLLLANELVDEAGIAWLAAELAADPGFEAYCYVDSPEGVAILDQVLTRHRAGRRLPVLVEIGHARGRTGARTDAQALAVARAAAATGTLRLAGVAGYEGSIGAGSQAQLLGEVASFCRRMRALAGQLRDQLGSGQRADGGEEFIVTAGGSAFFDVVTRELTAGGPDPNTGVSRITAILRSGAYLAHDHGYYGTVSPVSRGAAGAPVLRPALELWAQVLSRPEAGLALLGAGRRDAGFDKGLPVPLRAVRRDGNGADLAESELTELNDQHAYLRLSPGTELAPGDLVCLGISHPCTTFDKWRVIPVVSDDDRVTDMVHAFF